jgi:hypothetical protein
MSQNSNTSEEALKQEIVVKLENFITQYKWTSKLTKIDFFETDQDASAWWNCVQKKDVFFWFNFILYLSYASINPLFLSQKRMNIEEFAFAFSFLVTCVLVELKYFRIHQKRRETAELLTVFSSEFTRAECEKFSIEKRLKTFKRFISAYAFQMGTSIIFMALDVIVEYLKSGSKIFPFSIELPFDGTSNNFVYFLILAAIFYTHFLSIVIMVSDDHILYGIINLLSLEFKILSVKFQELKFQTSAELSASLKLLIDRHHQLHEAVNVVQSIFAPSFFMNFLLSAILICFSAIQLSTALNPQKVAFSIGFCLFNIAQILMQCFFGQLLRDASEESVRGIYDSGWEEIGDVQHKKEVVLVLLRSQKLAKISILGISVINMEQFGSVS